MQYWRRLSIVLIGFLESLLFSGCLFGWPSLLHVLQQEGVYSELCPHLNDSIGIDTTSSIPASTIFHSVSILPTIFTTKSLSRKATTSTPSELYETFSSVDSTGFDWERSSDFPNNFNTNQASDGEQIEPLEKRSAGIAYEDLHSNPGIDEKSIEQKVEKVIQHRKPCKEQTVQMTLIYTVAAVSYGLTSILIGFSLDILGLWFTRIGGCIMTSGGFFLLAFTTRDSSWMLWPALILIALGTSQLRLSSFQFANLWPKYRTTILILYSSAYSVSTTLFLVIQIAYVGHIPYQLIGLTLAIISLLTFPPTLIMPRMKIDVHEDEPQLPLNGKLRNVSIDVTPPKRPDDDVPRILRNKGDDDKFKNPFDEPEAEEMMKSNNPPDNVPLSTSLFTLSAGLHLLWHFVTFFLVLFYSATFMPWIQMVTDDPKIIEHYNKISGLCALIAPLFIPIAGLVTDRRIRKAAEQEDRVERLALTMQAPALAKAIASLFVLGTMICKVFFTPEAIYLSMILIAVSRPFIVGSCASYIQIRFHPSHFNRLNGIFTTIVSIMSLIQFPIVVWMKQSPSDFVKAQLLLIGLLILAFTSPGHMMIKPLARRYARNSLKFRTDI